MAARTRADLAVRTPTNAAWRKFQLTLHLHLFVGWTALQANEDNAANRVRATSSDRSVSYPWYAKESAKRATRCLRGALVHRRPLRLCSGHGRASVAVNVGASTLRRQDRLRLL